MCEIESEKYAGSVGIQAKHIEGSNGGKKPLSIS